MLTAFYMFRLLFLTFFGTYRGKAHPHESPLVITVPLMVLAVLSIAATGKMIEIAVSPAVTDCLHNLFRSH